MIRSWWSNKGDSEARTGLGFLYLVAHAAGRLRQCIVTFSIDARTSQSEHNCLYICESEPELMLSQVRVPCTPSGRNDQSCNTDGKAAAIKAKLYHG